MDFRFTTGDMPVSHTVLIIEDAVELAEVIEATLESMGIQSHHETHGERGFEQFKKIKPKLVLLDIALPDTKGWKILERIKTYTQETPEADMPKVVIISAYGDPANRLMGKLQDINRYLIKPFTPDEVERVVSSALGLMALPELPQIDTDPLADLDEILGTVSSKPAEQDDATPSSESTTSTDPEAS